jgi:energy-converting hydrogenase Eha subunit A
MPIITHTNYFRAAAALPILVSAISIVALRFGFDPLDMSGIHIIFLIYGAVPYIIFALVVLRLLRNKPRRAYWQAAIVAPFLFIPVFSMGVTVVGIFLDFWETGQVSLPTGSLLFDTLGYGLFILPIGYFYVALSYLGYLLLRWCGCIDAA